MLIVVAFYLFNLVVIDVAACSLLAVGAVLVFLEHVEGLALDKIRPFAPHSSWNDLLVVIDHLTVAMRTVLLVHF